MISRDSHLTSFNNIYNRPESVQSSAQLRSNSGFTSVAGLSNKMVLKQGYERFCVQTRTVPYTNPVTKATYNVLQCLNCEANGSCEWEFANNHEWDGTNDGSYWTSILTDNILATSPSIDKVIFEAPALADNQRPQLRDTDDFDDDDDEVDDDNDDDDDDDYQYINEETPLSEFSDPPDDEYDVRGSFGKKEAFKERRYSSRYSVHG